MGRVIVVIVGVVVALFGLLFALQGFGLVGGSPMSNSSMSAVDGLPPRRRIDELTAANKDSCRSMALTSRCFTTPLSPECRMRHSTLGAYGPLGRY